MDTQNVSTQSHPDVLLLSVALQDFAALWRKNFYQSTITDIDKNPSLEQDVLLYVKFNNACKAISETIGEIATRDAINRCKPQD